MNAGRVIIGFSLFLAAIGTAGAGGVASRPVRVADLDLRSDAGVTTLYARLKDAAGEVCGLDQARGHAERQRARRCQAATLEFWNGEARSLIARAHKMPKAYLSARADE